MRDGVSARERHRIELVERLQTMVAGSAEAVAELESMAGVVAGAGLGRVETYLFEGIVHDVRETQGRLSEFLEAVQVLGVNYFSPSATIRIPDRFLVFGDAVPG